MTVAEAVEELRKLPGDLVLKVDGDMGPYEVTGFKVVHETSKGITYNPKSTGTKVVVVW